MKIIGKWVVAEEGWPYIGEIVDTHGTRKHVVQFREIATMKNTNRWKVKTETLFEKYWFFDTKEEALAEVHERIDGGAGDEA